MFSFIEQIKILTPTSGGWTWLVYNGADNHAEWECSANVVDHSGCGKTLGNELCFAEAFSMDLNLGQNPSDKLLGNILCADCANKALGTIKEPEVEAKVKTLTSFSYKVGGVKPEADSIVLDVRSSIRNPWNIKELRSLNGKHKSVQDFISGCKKSREIINIVHTYLSCGYNVYVGCVGGKHRSVAVVELAAAEAAKSGLKVEVVHRDLKE